ncbi:2-dehydropantoate 2-reductase [Algiphilus sp.]|uniref:2-dehydropantoate 2-reductase n=1 Tax=Algiphilus sp. TaxID=1872431 RepID=UPI003B515CC8
MTASTAVPGAIGIFGAGSIGCYIGGRLIAAGENVRLIGRARMGEVIATHGLHISDWQGFDHQLSAAQVAFFSEADALNASALVLVAVKSADTEAAGRALAPVLAPGTVVLSLQNGVNNAARLQEWLPQQRVLAGMVPFNVVQHGPGHFHHGSEGALEAEADEVLRPWLRTFAAAGLPIQLREDMASVLWAKLLLNLNNPINALAGVPLKEELSQRAFRRCIALAQREALALYAAADIRPARLTPVPPRWLPRLLDVPDAIFQRLGQRMLRIDPLARSSMWEDLERGRRTEIDWINGELLRLAEGLGRTAPVNARLVALVREAEGGGRRDWNGPDLLAALESATQD